MTHWAKLEFFPDEYIELQKEIPFHPKLVELLEKHPAGEFEVRLSEVAAYCEILLDGTYLPEDLKKLCKILANRLYNMRPKQNNTGIVIIH